MKSKIKLSKFAIILTAIINVALFVGCICTVHELPAFLSILFIYLVLLISGLFYAPTAIKADSSKITIVGILKNRSIPMSEVAGVELFQPTMGAIRICASGGYMGYWGIFSEGDIGRYTAFYGKASDCFLVTTKQGAKYVLGCENPDTMVEYIKSQL